MLRASRGRATRTSPPASWPSIPVTRSDPRCAGPRRSAHGALLQRKRVDQEGGAVNCPLPPIAGSPLMRSLALLLSCAAVLVAGCSKEPESAPVAATPKPAIEKAVDRDEHSYAEPQKVAI